MCFIKGKYWLTCVSSRVNTENKRNNVELPPMLQKETIILQIQIKQKENGYNLKIGH
jgi:hypothetical protein